MRKILFFLLAFFSIKAFAQPTGSILPQQKNPEAGKENVYVYTPPKGLLIPDSSSALIVYRNEKLLKNKKVPLSKSANAYTFSFTAPDSVKCLVAGIINNKGDLIDTRNDAGYIIYLYNDKGSNYPGSRIDAADLLNGYARYYLQLKIPADSIVKMYEADYKLYPSYKKENTYLSYLSVLYKVKKDAVKPKLLQYAAQQMKIDSEQNWTNAINIYQVLKMNDKKDSLTNIILNKWPKGYIAMQKAYQNLNNATTADEKISMFTDFKQNFPQSNNNYNYFYQSIASSYEKEKNWDKYLVYADSIQDRTTVAMMYNNTAWNLSGQNIDSTAENLAFAKSISQKSINIINDEINNPEKYKPDYIDDVSDFKKQMQNTYETYADTYALLLYKINQPDSAFYYQSIAIQAPYDADVAGRYVFYAGKVKGTDFARQYLESEMMQGNTTPEFETTLKKLYTELNLSDADYNSFIAKATAAHLEKLKKEIIAKEENKPSKNFTLKNLNGETVSLASLKGKVVVVDFWATWCGPCKASFPGMQKAVEKYKDDKDVAFVFVDTWENKDATDMLSGATDFIHQHKYPFNVLLDKDNKTVEDYNVSGIPTKFIINKDGSIQFSSIGFGGDEDELLEEISMMIDMAKGANS